MKTVLLQRYAEAESPQTSLGAGITATFGVATALLALYALTYPLEGWHSAVGSDAPVYAWWARLSAAEGLSSDLLQPRPGVHGLIAAWSSLFHVSPIAIVAAIEPALAVCFGLSAGVLTAVVFGFRPFTFVAVALLCTTFVSPLIAGYLSTLTWGAVFFAGMASLALGMRDGRRSCLIAAGGLFGIAGLLHPVFWALGLPLAAGFILGAGFSRFSSEGGNRGQRSLPTRAWGAVVLGAALTLAGLALTGWVTGDPLPHAADVILRRAPGDAPLLHAYQERMLGGWHRLRFYIAGTGALGAASLVLAWRAGLLGRRPPPLLGAFMAFLLVWVAVVAVACVLLELGTIVPAQRLLTFALPVPLVAALGLSFLWRFRLSNRYGPVVRIAAFAAVAILGLTGWWAWARQSPSLGHRELKQVARGDAVLARSLPSTSLVVLRRPSYEGLIETVKLANYLRLAAPPDRIADVQVFPGTWPRFLDLARSNAPEPPRRFHWKSSLFILPPHFAARDEVIVLRAADPASFREVRRLPGARMLAPGVVAAPGFNRGLRPPANRAVSAALRELSISPFQPLWLSALLLVFASAVGWPWARVALPAEPVLWPALAPSLGLAAATAGAVVVGIVAGPLGGAAGVLGGLLPLAAAAGLALSQRIRKAARSSPVQGSSESRRVRGGGVDEYGGDSTAG